MGSSASPLTGAPPGIKALASSPTISRKLQSKQLANTVLSRSNSKTFLVCATANMAKGKGSSGRDIIMVDPSEAKRLAAKQLLEIQAKEKLKRDRQIEAINGAWAMIGLTAGLVVEGETGKGILSQLAGYWGSLSGFFTR